MSYAQGFDPLQFNTKAEMPQVPATCPITKLGPRRSESKVADEEEG